LGHTIYYRVNLRKWKEFVAFIKRACSGLELETVTEGNVILIFPNCRGVEPLRIPKVGEGFVKTNLVEPCHSIYTLVLYSISSFGGVSVWED